MSSAGTASAVAVIRPRADGHTALQLRCLTVSYRAQSGEVRTDGYAPSEDEEAEVRAAMAELSEGTLNYSHLWDQCDDRLWSMYSHQFPFRSM